MRYRTLLFSIPASILVLLTVLLSFRFMGAFTISSFTVEGMEATYNIEHYLLPAEGRNRSAVSLKAIKKKIEKLPYIESASIKMKGKIVKVDCTPVEDGLVITDGSDYYFYSDTLAAIDGKDVYELSDRYIVLYMEKDLLSLFLSSSFGSEELKMIDTLKGLKEHSCLITKAEYDNNNSSIFSGSLVLGLDSINSLLTLNDIRNIDRLEESLGIIESEYINSKDKLSGVRSGYLLSSGMLVKTR